MAKLVQVYGAEGVCARLGMRPGALQMLMDGTVSVPDPLLIRAVDLLLDVNPADPVPPLTQDAPPKTRPLP